MTATSTVLVIAVPAAIVGAASFGMASVVQQQATKRVPRMGTLNPRLLLALVRDPVWVASVLTVIVGLSLQMVGLAFAPLVLVQPLLLTSVVFGAVFSAWYTQRRLDKVLLGGVLCCVAGLAAFLTVARPSGAGAAAIGPRGIPLAVALGAVLAGCLVVASRARDEIRVFALALATGILYGTTAALMKIVAGQFRSGGIAEPFHDWVLYAVCVIGPAGFLLSQNAFQRGRFLAPALTVIAVADPLVGLITGIGWFGEQIAVTPLDIAGEVLAALVLISGIALLIQRSERLRREVEDARHPSDESPGG